MTHALPLSPIRGPWLAVLVLWLWSVSAPAATTLANAEASFDAANRLYEQGHFAAAATAYEQLLATGQTAATIHHNLGNAYFRTNQLGRAIWNYRMALRLTPRDPDCRANLQFARNAVQAANPPPEPFWQRQIMRLSLNEWTVLASAALWVWMGLLAAGQLRPAWKPALLRPLIVGGVATGLLTITLFAAQHVWAGDTWAIVSQTEVVLRHGPLEESPNLQLLHDGQELRVLDAKDDWLQVDGAQRGIGWLRRDQVLLLSS